MYRWADNGREHLPKPTPVRGREPAPEEERRERTRGARGPAVESVTKRTRRTFGASEKLRILKRVEEALAGGERGAVGEVLREEGIYSSHLAAWRAQMGDRGTVGACSRGDPTNSSGGSGGSIGSSGHAGSVTLNSPDRSWSGPGVLGFAESGGTSTPYASLQLSMTTTAGEGLTIHVFVDDPDLFLDALTLPVGPIPGHGTKDALMVLTSATPTNSSSWRSLDGGGSATLKVQEGQLFVDGIFDELGALSGGGPVQLRCIAELPALSTGKAPAGTSTLREDPAFESPFCQRFSHLRAD
jgi:hypothetical protein